MNVDTVPDQAPQPDPPAPRWLHQGGTYAKRGTLDAAGRPIGTRRDRRQWEKQQAKSLKAARRAAAQEDTTHG